MARPEQGNLGVEMPAAVWAEPSAWLRLCLAAALVALLAVSAQIAVHLPGTPVPVTLQDLTVLIVGVVLGPVQGAATVAAYVVLGAAGAPVFSNGHAGFAWLLGPTGGYLLAFPVAALAAGAAAARNRPTWLAVAGLLAAWLVVFGAGVLQLAIVSGRGVRAAIDLGFVPFLPGIAFKSALFLVFVLAWRKAGAGSAAEE